MAYGIVNVPGATGAEIAAVRALAEKAWEAANADLPIATQDTLGGVLSGANIDVDSAGAVTVSGKRNSTMVFADIPTENVTYNELLARVAGYYAEINSKLKAPEQSSAGYLIASDGEGGTTLVGIANEATE
ncbi:MAG: hypothetical protein IJA35_00865, partial [Clostridia bacterium]|nr:hypothetical protein [Clostridia bacterium]